MRTPQQLDAFPWDALERVSRPTVVALGQLSHGLPQNLDLKDVGQALTDILGAETSIVFRRFCDVPAPRDAPEALHFSFDDDAIGASLSLDPQLVTECLSKLLQQAPGIAGQSPLSEARVRGAVARICVEASRRAWGSLKLGSELVPKSSAFGSVGAQLSVIHEGRPYDVSVSLTRLRPSTPRAASLRLAALGPLPIRVPLFGALCAVERADLETLTVGDALLPGAAWWLTPEGKGCLAMAAEAAQRGVFFEIVDSRNVKLVGVQDLPNSEESAMPEPVDPELSERVADAVLDAPVIVRVEVASLSLSAEAFANLKPGDIVATQQPLGQLSTLRAAGREVAQGELVNVDGELGVRIRKLIGRQ